MKNLKMKAWNPAEKKMSAPFTLGNCCQECGYIRADNGNFQFEDSTYNPSIYLLYTGLKDKNNKEIYEGDIVNIGNYFAKVYWEFGGFALMTKDSIRLLLEPTADKLKMYKVVGNIYENPELLK